ncbi:MAG TPA: hypothetical protein VL614_28790 [Acetobacteraceae bacterium]|nr:hypothetical protein [Acetobacteraceae bacterium]
MPVTMSPTPRFVLSWDMFDEVPNIEPDHGQSMDADTKCKFDVAWNGDDVTVTVGPDSLRVRAGASKTAELLKHEQGHSDITYLTGLATGRAIARNSSGSQATIRSHQVTGQRVQARYDRQTEHGRNSAQQTRWNQLLDDAIQHNLTTVDGQAL